MLIHALKPHNNRLNTSTGVINVSRLMPLERAAVNSWSALNRPNTSNAAVNIPIGSANTSTNGINSKNASATPLNVACRRISNSNISFSPLPSSSTNVNTATVITSVASTWRVR